MSIIDILRDKRELIIESCFELLITSYPNEAAKHLKRVKKEIENPLGYSLYDGIKDLFDSFYNNDDELSEKALDEIIRIRAVQQMKASEALRFVSDMKTVIRREISDKELKEYLELSERLDEIHSKAIDKYIQCREKIYEIRANEVKARTFKMIDRLNKKYDYLDTKFDTDENINN